MITCAACTRLENRVILLKDYGTYHCPGASSTVTGAADMREAKENLSKHREICSIYKGENDDK